MLDLCSGIRVCAIEREPWGDRQTVEPSPPSFPRWGTLRVPCQSLLDLDCGLGEIDVPDPQPVHLSPTAPGFCERPEGRAVIAGYRTCDVQPVFWTEEMAITREAFGQLNIDPWVAWYPLVLGRVCANGRHASVLPMNGCPSTWSFVHEGLSLEPGQLAVLNMTELWIHVILHDARIPSDGRVSFVRLESSQCSPTSSTVSFPNRGSLHPFSMLVLTDAKYRLASVFVRKVVGAQGSSDRRAHSRVQLLRRRAPPSEEPPHKPLMRVD